ncbi:MAG: alanine racemase, partial [Chitinophagaceae bacterium]
AISKHIQAFKAVFVSAECYPNTTIFLQKVLHNNTQQFSNQYILLKGARKFAFEQIAQAFEQKVHQTILEVNLTAMAHNLKQYQQQLLPTTKLMAMVKAFSYGSGSVEIARLLQFHKVDYLAVAYADEGIELRKAGIHLPIMVMNIDEAGFAAMIEYSLEPEMYSFNILESFHQYLLHQGITQFPVHIKLNTGMNRLGFEVTDLAKVCSFIQLNKTMMVKSLFSHLVASENPIHDDFTQHQSKLFNTAIQIASTYFTYPFLQHLANSSAIFRHPHLQYNMVRLGIGLYGVHAANRKTIQLETVATLKTTIAQIRTVAANETIGYNRMGKVNRASVIATIRIGYADGLNRKLSNGVGKVFVRGKLAPIIGNICMDMTMIDVTDISNVQEGDIVEIFGKNIPIETVAQQIQTIAYEVMTSVSQRVKRVYIQE